VGSALSWDLIVRDKSEAGTKSFVSNLDGLKDKAKETGKAIGVGFGAAGAVAGGLLAKGFADNMDIAAGRAKLAGQMGLTGGDAKKAGQIAAGAYADNFGGSLDDVNEAIRAVGQNLGDVSEMSIEDSKSMTEQLLAFSDTMGVDVPQAAEAAGKMIANGLAKDSTEAFDILTTGFQNGTNKADDLLDTFNEYSPQFQKLGINGKTALGLLSQGLQNGARDTDVIADSFKEFSIRAVDGSKTTVDAYKSLGLNAKGMAAEIGKGGPTAEKATGKIVKALQSVKDPVERQRIGVELFGTQFEDLGQKAFQGFDVAAAGATKVDGATKKMSDTVGNTAAGRVETAKRKFEQWTQSMAKSDSVLGTVVTGVGAFGGGALAAGTQVATMGVALKGTAVAELAMNSASKVAAVGIRGVGIAMRFAMGPWGLVIGAAVVLGVGLIALYKKSTTFRNGVNAVFKGVAKTALWLADKWLMSFQMIAHAAGKLPGPMGAPFRAADKAIGKARAKLHSLSNDLDHLNGKRVSFTINGRYTGPTTVAGQRVGGGSGSSRGGITAFAKGGPVKAGVPAIVGDGGREELFVPENDGYIYPSVPPRGFGKPWAGSGSGYDDPPVEVHLHFHGPVLGSPKAMREAVVKAFENTPAGGRRLPKGSVAT
jgi:phage-related minor tail protein